MHPLEMSEIRDLSSSEVKREYEVREYEVKLYETLKVNE